MNAALINYLESLPEEHLQTHLAAYPWFTAARVVLTKKKPNIEVLRSAAVYVQDRGWFKNYYEAVNNTLSNDTAVEISIADNLQEATNAELDVNEINEQPILDSATNVLEDVVTIPQQKIENQKIEENTALQQSIQEPEAGKVTELEEDVIEEDEADLTQPKSFNDWLQTFSVTKEGKVTTTKPVKEKVDELETLIQSNIPYQMVETKIEAETHYAKGLDNFIQQQKQLKKAANANPVFDETTKLPVTETFAKLLVGQNKLKQAISIYQRLSLKFPSKSAYFAAHIKELESKI